MTKEKRTREKVQVAANVSAEEEEKFEEAISEWRMVSLLIDFLDRAAEEKGLFSSAWYHLLTNLHLQIGKMLYDKAENEPLLPSRLFSSQRELRAPA